jgi:hypothetical protein
MKSGLFNKPTQALSHCADFITSKKFHPPCPAIVKRIRRHGKKTAGSKAAACLFED